MNKKLKELIEQATVNRGRMRVVDIEILAELIVKECVAICEDTDGEHIADARWGRRCCALEIKEHFGIEGQETIEHCSTCNEPWSGTSCGLDNCGWITGEQGGEE